MRPFVDIECDIDALVEMPLVGGSASDEAVKTAVTSLLSCGEDVLEAWVHSRGETPTTEHKEGFRLLALQRQGSKGEPSFNACRETCRELAYHYNLVTSEPTHPETAKRVQMAALVTRHLLYFVEGKLTAEGLGEFCCSSKPVRRTDIVA